MSNISDKDLDKLFKDAAERYQSSFDDGAWGELQERLDGGSDGFTYFKTIGGIIGVFILGAILIWLYSPEGVNDNTKDNLNGRQAMIGDNLQLGEQESLEQGERLSFGPADDPVESPDQESGKVESDTAGEPIGEAISGSDQQLPSMANKYGQTVVPDAPLAATVNRISDRENSQKNIVRVGTSNDNADAPVLLERLGYLIPELRLPTRALNKVEPPVVLTHNEATLPGAVALKLAYSPDLTSVGYFNPDRPGSNYGIMIEYFVGNRWSISAGAIYSRKIYATEEKQSYGYYSGSVISSTHGDCRVVDIPLNISYYLNRSDKHGLFITAGSSSYLMLEEIYDYIKVKNGHAYTSSQKIENENHHFFGLLNLSIGYERRIRGNFFLQVEPFLKAPLTGIGAGKIDLVSTGAFLNLKLHLK